MDRSRVRGKRGRGGFKGENIVERRKACELIDGSSMLSACLFLPFIFLNFFWAQECV